MVKVLYASNTINAIYLSSPFLEKSSFFLIFFCSSEESGQRSCSPDTHTTHSNLLNPVLSDRYTYFTAKEAFNDVKGLDKKNQLDVTFCILYFSSNSCSTCFR